MAKPVTEPSRQAIETQLLAELENFTSFVRRRVGDPHLAADVVQESLLKAMKTAHALRDDERAVAWFYRVLRHSIIDLHRRNAAKRTALERFEREMNLPPDPEEERVACGCVERLISALHPDYAELIRRLDVRGESAEHVGQSLGLSANNLRVRHHRARRQLRERVEQTCRLCAKHGCLDCDCAVAG